MTISFRTTPTPGIGTTTTLAFTLPTGHTTDDCLIAYGTHKPYNSTISSGTVTTDYTALAAGANGTVANGNGTGSNYTYARYRVHDGSESNPTGTLSAAPSPRFSGMLAAFSDNEGSTWGVVSCKGSDTTTTGTTFSATGDVALAFAPDDVLIVITGTPDNAAIPSALALAASGITFSAVTTLYNNRTNTGNDATISVYYATVTAGTATVAPSATMTTSSNDSNGQTTFIRLREPNVQGLTAVGIAEEGGVGTPVASTGPVTLTATGIAEEGGVGTPTANTSASLTATGIAEQGGVGTPTSSTSTNLTATGIAEQGGVGTPVASTGPVTLTATGIAEQGGVGTPVGSTVTSLTATGIAEQGGVGTPVAAVGATTLTAIGIAETGGVGTPVGTSTVTLTGVGIAEQGGVGTPVSSTITTLVSVGVAEQGGVGVPVASQTVTPAEFWGFLTI